MEIGKLSRLAVVLALCMSLSVGAAPLFKKSEGSLGADVPLAARSAVVTLDRGALRDLQSGAELTIGIPGVGNHKYHVVRRSQSGDVVLIEGVHDKIAKHRIVLGVRAEGVTGVISTPEGVYSLGYMNGEQWLGVAGAADLQRLAQSAERPVMFTQRVPAKSEKAPVKGAQPIDISLAKLTEMQPGEEATLVLSDLGPLRVSYEETRAGADSSTWVGYLSDFGKDYRVLLTYSPTGSTGHILTPQGEYSIESTASGATYLIDPRKLGLTRVEGDASCTVAVAPHAANDVTGNATPGTASSTAPAAATALPGSTIVDVLVLYTPGFVADKGGVAQAQAAIDHLMALTNQSYVDSGVAMQIRKVGAEQVSASDTTSNSTELSALTNGTGAYSNVKARRDALGADMVSIVRPFHNQYHAGCGIAWIGGYNGSPISNSSSHAYSVVSEGKDRAGSGWYCDVTSFAHELGHNQGLMHDRKTVLSQGGGQGATPYAYGYGLSGTFGTVMSYLWPKVGKFSNPNDFSCGGTLRCGVPASDTANSADNAQALNFTRTGVAAYRTASPTNPPPSTTTRKISGVITVNGVPRPGASIIGTGATCTLAGTNGVYQCTVKVGFTGSLKARWYAQGSYARFTPRFRSYSNLTTNQVNQNFAGVW